MDPVEFALFSFGTLFVIVDPVAAVPAFVAMTAHSDVADRLRTAKLAASVTAGLLATFSLIGQHFFRIIGVSLPALQVAGGLLLLLVALDMLRAQRSAVQETAEETAAGVGKHEVAITPLAIPMMAGPAAISSVILLSAQARGWLYHLILLGCVAAVGLVTYVILGLAAKGTQWLSPLAEKIITRLMGLLLAALAVQFILNAFTEAGLMPGH